MLGLHFLNFSSLNWSNSIDYVQDTIFRETNTKAGDLNSYGFGFAFWFTGGFFPKDNLLIGLGFGKDGGSNGVGVMLEPFVRYYLRQKKVCFSFNNNSSRFALFIEADIRATYGTWKEDKDTAYARKANNYSLGSHIAIGVTYLIFRGVAIELMPMYGIRYSDYKSKVVFKSTGQEQTNRIKGNSGGMNIYLGIQVYF